jgi:hypothetical protein
MDGIGLDHGDVGDGCKPVRIPDVSVGAASAAMLFFMGFGIWDLEKPRASRLKPLPHAMVSSCNRHSVTA